MEKDLFSRAKYEGLNFRQRPGGKAGVKVEYFD